MSNLGGNSAETWAVKVVGEAKLENFDLSGNVKHLPGVRKGEDSRLTERKTFEWDALQSQLRRGNEEREKNSSQREVRTERHRLGMASAAPANTRRRSKKNTQRTIHKTSMPYHQRRCGDVCVPPIQERVSREERGRGLADNRVPSQIAQSETTKRERRGMF